MYDSLITYFEDINIPSNDEYEELVNLTRILENAWKCGLQLNLIKSQFMKHKITCLDHIIDNCTIKLSSEETNAVQSFPWDWNAKEIHSFLRLTGFLGNLFPFIELYQNL